MLETMKPESEWFRPPKVYPMNPWADHERYLLVAEPEINGGVWGVSYTISSSLIEAAADPIAMRKMLADAAMVELRRRIGMEEYKRGEGEEASAFKWEPVCRRYPDGRIEIENA